MPVSSVLILGGLAAVFMIGILLAVYGKGKVKSEGKQIVNLLGVLAVLFVTIIIELMLVFTSRHPGVYCTALGVGAVAACVLLSFFIWGVKKKAGYFFAGGVLAACIVFVLGFNLYHSWNDKIAVLEEREGVAEEYLPYGRDSKTAVLLENSALRLKENLPVLSGTQQLFPVYSAFAKAVYPEDVLKIQSPYSSGSEVLCCAGNVETAYQDLIDGKADLIFAGAPTKQEQAAALERGLELKLTPVGKEAFVFFVNTKNPVNNLTKEQIQEIYEGTVTNWKQLGGKQRKIQAFQRAEGSVSQKAMLELMEGKPMMEPPKGDVTSGISGRQDQPAVYKNYTNAIGYSTRFDTMDMIKSGKIKFLSIGGVFPDNPMIADGTYPFSETFYAVTAGSMNPNIEALLQWIISPQGQSLVREAGYVPVAQVE